MATKSPADVHEKPLSTRNATSSNAKQVSISLLNASLADGVDLALAIKQAHWNIKGPDFIGVHKMLDGMRKQQDELNDLMAERAVVLGGVALGTTQVVSKETRVAAYPTDIHPSLQHIKALADRTATCANAVREAIDQTDEAGDAATSDLFTQACRDLDQRLWFLEAHLQ